MSLFRFTPFVCLIALVTAFPAHAELAQSAAPPTRITSARDGLDYIAIPAGAFEMGAVPGDEEALADEQPRHVVTLTKPFWLGRTEVTRAAFRRFVADTRFRTTAESDGWSWVVSGEDIERKEDVDWKSPGFEAGEDHPVVHLSWYDAEAFCSWTGGRLPTEAEWEYAARGGEDGRKYLWGDTPAPVVAEAKQANIADESAKRVFPAWTVDPGYDDGFAYTAPAGAFAPNGFGLHDMTGNVAEWTADWYGERRYAPGGETADPKGPDAGVYRVVRGGAWIDRAPELRLSYRSHDSASAHLPSAGFRCARDAAP